MRHLIQFLPSGNYVVADLEHLACSYCLREAELGSNLYDFDLRECIEPYVLELKRFRVLRSQEA